MQQPVNVLFLCTGNSARSVLAEALLRSRGADRFRAFSAGSRPKGVVHALALRQLRRVGLPTDGLRSKSWDELAVPGAPEMDIVITVCDSAAREACPAWPGHPVSVHWGVDDPAEAGGTEADRERAFDRAYRELEARIQALVQLPVETLGRDDLLSRLRRIAAEATNER